jgi:Ca2+/H+ antiporter, TMEM165/GDT1 family
VEASWLSFVVVFVAELGDKSQLMALAFAIRYRALPVLIGITIASALVLGVSVLAGAFLGSSLPQEAVSIVAGLAFFAFAVWTWRGDSDDEPDRSAVRSAYRSPVVAVGVAFFLAELGDKTMLATITLATTEAWLGTWIGATLGLVTADGLAIVLGRQLGSRLPDKAVRIGAASLFALFGIWMVVRGLTS